MSFDIEHRKCLWSFYQLCRTTWVELLLQSIMPPLLPFVLPSQKSPGIIKLTSHVSPSFEFWSLFYCTFNASLDSEMHHFNATKFVNTPELPGLSGNGPPCGSCIWTQVLRKISAFSVMFPFIFQLEMTTPAMWNKTGFSYNTNDTHSHFKATHVSGLSLRPCESVSESIHSLLPLKIGLCTSLPSVQEAYHFKST